MLRALRIGVVVALVLIGVGGCSTLFPPSYEPAAAQASQHDIFVASLREQNIAGPRGAARARAVSYAKAEVSVPGQRRVGTITPVSRQNDPRRDFIDLGARSYEDRRAFASAVAQDAASRSPEREVMIFVHGFNTDFDTSLFRFAQMDADIHIPAAKVLFAWPTTHKLHFYLHDLESTLYARDGLEELIEALSAAPVKRIVLVGHSMGATLVMETLRQMHIHAGRQAFRKIGGVVFLSPDMDAEVFRQSASRIAPLPQPFVIYGSQEDKLLRRFSWALANGTERLGAPDDLSLLSALDVTFVDVTRAEADTSHNHLAVAASPTMIALVNAMQPPDLARFGAVAANGGIPGAQVMEFGQAKAVMLPAM